MARKIKDRWLGARVDEDMEQLAAAYIEAADLTMGELIRYSVKEFIERHPAGTVELPPITKLRKRLENVKLEEE